jgi:hypothetical protein
MEVWREKQKEGEIYGRKKNDLCKDELKEKSYSARLTDVASLLIIR